MNFDLSGHKIEIECPNCGQPLKFSLAQVGGAVVCPGCRASIELSGEDSGSITGQIKEKPRK